MLASAMQTEYPAGIDSPLSLALSR
jgi:hypothetical protein